jgi:hypothetical protein
MQELTKYVSKLLCGVSHRVGPRTLISKEKQMGRPINKKYFGNTNSPYDNGQTGGATGVGGEGIQSVVSITTGSGYSTSTTVTWVAGSPTIPGGVVASGTVIVNNSGVPTSFNVDVSGSGYTTTATTLTFTPNPTTTGTFLVTLTTGRQNALNFTAWAPTAFNGSPNTGGSAVIGDIVKQQGTSRYYIRTSEGYGVCKLVATTATIGTMVLEATDANGNTYYVTRLASKKARLTRKTQNGSSDWVYETGDLAKWTFVPANGTDKNLVTTTVSISNI